MSVTLVRTAASEFLAAAFAGRSWTIGELITVPGLPAAIIATTAQDPIPVHEELIVATMVREMCDVFGPRVFLWDHLYRPQPGSVFSNPEFSAARAVAEHGPDWR